MNATWFYEHAVPFVATAGALFTLYWRVKALKVGIPGWEAVNGIIAALAMFYIVAWTLLWTGIIDDRRVWSQYVGVVSAVSFFLVWGWPARKQIKDREQDRQSALDALAGE